MIARVCGALAGKGATNEIKSWQRQWILFFPPFTQKGMAGLPLPLVISSPLARGMASRLLLACFLDVPSSHASAPSPLLCCLPSLACCLLPSSVLLLLPCVIFPQNIPAFPGRTDTIGLVGVCRACGDVSCVWSLPSSALVPQN